jgi:hypothetical protein
VRELADEQPTEPTLEEQAEAISHMEVGQFLVMAVSTLASLAYGTLERGELSQSKAAIDAIRALLPVMKGHAEEDFVHDFERALANLQIAYADAASKSA